MNGGNKLKFQFKQFIRSTGAYLDFPRVKNSIVTGEMKMEQGFCNTFVVLPPLTGNGSVIFGKNSDRPTKEVQELVYEPSKQCTAGEPLKVKTL